MATQKKNITVRLDDDTRIKLELIAGQELRPVANQIAVFVKQGIEQYEKYGSVNIIRDPENGEWILVDRE